MHIDTEIWAASIGAVISTCVGVLLTGYAGARKDRVWIERIKDPGRQRDTLLEALQIYDDEDRISEEDKDDSEDIDRWLREVLAEKRRGDCKLEDYFLVARNASHVLGMAYAHLYPSVQKAFFSYLVVPRPAVGHPESLGYKKSGSRVAVKLLARLRSELLRSKKCKLVVTEVEDPGAIADPDRKRTARSRIIRLQGLADGQKALLRSVDVLYRQPRLDLDDPEAQERPLRLMVVVPKTSENRQTMTRNEFGEILDFLAECIYGDQFEDEPERDKRYRAYLMNEWKVDLIRSAPEEIELCSCRKHRAAHA